MRCSPPAIIVAIRMLHDFHFDLAYYMPFSGTFSCCNSNRSVPLSDDDHMSRPLETCAVLHEAELRPVMIRQIWSSHCGGATRTSSVDTARWGLVNRRALQQT